MHALKLVLPLALILAFKPAKQSEENRNETGGGNVAADGTAAPNNTVTDENLTYTQLYCKHVGKLRLRVDVNTQLANWCVDDAPTEKMDAYRVAALGAEAGKIELELIKSEAVEATDESEFIIAWSFHVPIRPFEVKERPIYDYVAQNYDGETVTLASTAARQPDEGVDFGLHLWSTKMNYKVTVKATETTFLNSERNTEYNLYQVQSGNEEMGFGVETMVDAENTDFLQSTMLNLSFNDGSGYNDGNGGTVVITMLHFRINNNGFPETAEKSIMEIAQHTANAMYSGLTK